MTSSTITIVCFGDSITASGWPDVLQEVLLARRIITSCINAGIRGNTSTQGLRRIDKDVLSRKPDIVIVEFGFNDCNQVLNSPRPRTSLSDFRRNIEAIVTRVRLQGAAAASIANHRSLMPRTLSDGRPYEAHSEEYNEVVRESAVSLGIPLLDMHSRFPGPHVTLADALAEDGIHLSQKGIRAYGEITARFLLDTLPERLQAGDASHLRTR